MADFAEGTEELGSDVGEDAGALGGDAIADEEKQEPCEELVDFIGGAEFGDLWPHSSLGQTPAVYFSFKVCDVGERKSWVI